VHTIDVLYPENDGCFSERGQFERRWRESQFARMETERDRFWFETFNDADFGPSIAIVGQPSSIRRILFDPALMPAAARDRWLCVLRPHWPQIEKRLQMFANDFGMSPAVTRLVVALFQTGDLRVAAARMGVGYETAREYLATARILVGAENQQNLITLVGLGIANTGRNAEESDALLAYAYGLSERQTQVAAMIANGAARWHAAQALGVSEALIKKEIAHVFAAVDVSNAAALARVVVELRLLAIATTLHDAGDPFPEAVHHDLTIDSRDGRVIAASDYGPRSGQPLLVLHSSMTNRPANRALIETLQNSGYRPIAMDRPGFGDTDAAPDDCRGEEYFNLAARDIVDLCRANKWSRIKLVARGAAQVILALHRENFGLIEAAVIMNPDPDAQSSSKQIGFLAATKRNFARRPWAVALISRWAVQSLTFARLSDNVLRSAANCPADARIMADPGHMRDYYRGVLAFREGKLDGLIREQTALATLGTPAPLPGTSNLTLLVGDQDSIHEPGETLRYWRRILPDACVEMVSGAGRFMSYSHPHLVIKALARRVPHR